MAKGSNRNQRRPVAGGKRQGIIRQKFKLVNKALAVVGGAPGYGSVAAFQFPQGNILLHGLIGYLRISTADADITATFDGDISLGTGATADGALSGAEINVVASTALGAATAQLSPLVRLASATTANGVIHDNTAGDLVFYLNLIIDDATISGAAEFLVNGYIEPLYTVLGDD